MSGDPTSTGGPGEAGGAGPGVADSGGALVQVRNLKKHYPITKGLLNKEVGRVKAVDGISFDISRGETLGLVGESGCGKSTAATSMIRLEEPTDGDVYFDGQDITEYNDRELKRFRRRAQMIFQDPTSSFDPRMSIGESVGEPLKIHGLSERSRRREIVMDLLERVGLQAEDIDRYPHEFSGGQKQRIALARALSVNPDMIVADEPASALDVSIQADILSLLDDLQDEFGLAILFISHDLGVIKDICDRVAVMYLGEIVEQGPVEEVFSNPQHPYTRALIDSIPTADPRQRGMSIELSGSVPTPSNPPSGCHFHTRCPEIIPPEGLDVPQDQWRAIMNLRIAVREGRIDLEGLREFAVAETDAEDVEAVSDTQLTDAVRQEYNVPQPVADADAEDDIASAVESLVTGNFDDAEATFADSFSTVCEREEPELKETSVGHPAACHLHDQSIDHVETGEPAVSDD